MKTLRFAHTSTRFTLSSVLAFCLASTLTVTASGQKERVVRHNGSTVEIREFTPVPEATEPCTPEESEWWKQLRKAGNDLYKKDERKTRERFYLLLYEGQQKGYRVPLKDRPYQPFLVGKTVYPAMARKNKVEGNVVLSVEFKADGSVGDVRLIEGLGMGLDEISIQAARQAVFLPAIKDGAFVTSRKEVKYGFDLPGGKIL
jgi:TonB family protein